jgi:hypothetical protein
MCDARLRIHRGPRRAEPFHPCATTPARAKVPVCSSTRRCSTTATVAFRGLDNGRAASADPPSAKWTRTYRSAAPSPTTTRDQKDMELGGRGRLACVPGVFPPWPVGLYAEGVRVEWGTAACTQTGRPGPAGRRCTELLVSDASGQMDDVPSPAELFSVVPGQQIPWTHRRRTASELLASTPPPPSPPAPRPPCGAFLIDAGQTRPEPGSPTREPRPAVPRSAEVQDLLSPLRRPGFLQRCGGLRLMLDGTAWRPHAAGAGRGPGHGCARLRPSPCPTLTPGPERQPRSRLGPWAFTAIAPEFDRPEPGQGSWTSCAWVGARFQAWPCVAALR